MARDYKPRSAKPARTKKRKAAKPATVKAAASPRRAPSWLWVGLGFGLGLGVAYGVHVYHTGELPGSAFAGNPSAPRAEKAARPAPTNENKTRFEFYSLLPEMEVVVPDNEVIARRRTQPTEAKLRPERSSPDRYILQAGAFRRLADADRLKASLALTGLEATIQTVAVDGATAWHRVRLGPYSDLPTVRDIRARLRRSKIDAMVLKITI